MSCRGHRCTASLSSPPNQRHSHPSPSCRYPYRRKAEFEDASASKNSNNTSGMDQQDQRGRSPSAGNQQFPIKQSPSLSPNTYPPGNDASSVGLGLDLDQPAFHQQPATAQFAYNSSTSGFLTPGTQQTTFDPTNQPLAPQPADGNLTFTGQTQASYMGSSYNEAGDFSLFPPSAQPGDQFEQPLFESSSLDPSDINNMSSPQINQSPTPPHLLKPEPQGSPAFSQNQHFSSPPSNHSRHTSLGPEAALLPNQLGDWSQPQFQTHRRTPSEYSEVSSVSHSPNLVSHDNFDPADSSHSPMQRAQDPALYQEVLNIGNFSLSDPQHSPNLPGRSPSHSPAMSPRIPPAQGPDMGQPAAAFGLAPPQPSPYGGAGYPAIQGGNEAFPSLQQPPDVNQQAMPPPSINIDFAPTAGKSGFEPSKGSMDADSLIPPDTRGMCLCPSPGRVALVTSNTFCCRAPTEASSHRSVQHWWWLGEWTSRLGGVSLSEFVPRVAVRVVAFSIPP